ncbi:MAG: hypothetical protein JSS07_04320 [Proteobacteria bacterium]|nr:hypothetical protein [Pseudomonadota bacterium]
MALSSDNLIEKFATLLEEGEFLDSEAFAERTIEIIALLSVEPSLDDTMQKINAKLQAMIQNSNRTQIESMETGMSAKFCAAKEIRDLKKTAYMSIPENLH